MLESRVEQQVGNDGIAVRAAVFGPSSYTVERLGSAMSSTAAGRRALVTANRGSGTA
jgi:hypothetical protein